MKTENADRHQVDLSSEEMASFPNGGRVVVYNAIDRTTGDFRRILSCAKFFAQQGKQVVMPPILKVPYKNPVYDQYSALCVGRPIMVNALICWWMEFGMNTKGLPA